MSKPRLSSTVEVLSKEITNPKADPEQVLVAARAILKAGATGDDEATLHAIVGWGLLRTGGNRDKVVHHYTQAFVLSRNVETLRGMHIATGMILTAIQAKRDRDQAIAAARETAGALAVAMGLNELGADFTFLKGEVVGLAGRFKRATGAFVDALVNPREEDEEEVEPGPDEPVYRVDPDRPRH